MTWCSDRGYIRQVRSIFNLFILGFFVLFLNSITTHSSVVL